MITSTKHYKSIESAIVKFNKLTGNIDCPVALIYLQKSKMNIDVSFLSDYLAESSLKLIL